MFATGLAEPLCRGSSRLAVHDHLAGRTELLHKMVTQRSLSPHPHWKVACSCSHQVLYAGSSSVVAHVPKQAACTSRLTARCMTVASVHTTAALLSSENCPPMSAPAEPTYGCCPHVAAHPIGLLGIQAPQACLQGLRRHPLPVQLQGWQSAHPCSIIRKGESQMCISVWACDD